MNNLSTNSMLHKAILMLFVTLTCVTQTSNAQKSSYKFAQRDTSSLWMDVYQPSDDIRKDICVVYIFGGGFVRGSRDASQNVNFYKELITRGFTVVAIDYRLGLKGVDKVGPCHPKPVFEAVRMASEDLVSAVSFILDNSAMLRVNAKNIVLVGSSAGAITALQTDYELANRSIIVKSLPQDFHFAGVVSLAGAIFSTHGTPRYASTPAPTLFYHGTADKVVIYNKIQILNRGMFGSKSLAKTFKGHKYPFMIVRYKDIGHAVAEFPRFYSTDQICSFINSAASGKFNDQIDMMVKDRNLMDKYRK